MSKYKQAIKRFDALNAEDPNREWVDGIEWPRELLYARRMSAWLKRLQPHAPETLRLAARSQHIKRWHIPRTDFPADRQGYHRWRRQLARFHARTAALIMSQIGYQTSQIQCVEALLRKQNLSRDADAQCLEDVICVVFLNHYFDDFATRHEQRKLISILAKTWRKMSPHGREFALHLHLPAATRTLIGKALEV